MNHGKGGGVTTLEGFNLAREGNEMIFLVITMGMGGVVKSKKQGVIRIRRF